MKLINNTFQKHVGDINTYNIHSTAGTNCPALSSIQDLRNIVFYGPPGIGKYSQALNVISKYSPSELRYEKKLTVLHNKQIYLLKISDIHYEIDMSVLGCNSKSLWSDAFQQIVDVISSKQHKTGIILCKHFHLIQKELLENFYSFMQNNHIPSGSRVIFFIITDSLSFLPTNIQNASKIKYFGKPSKAKVIRMEKTQPSNDLKGINGVYYERHTFICDKIIQNILNYEKIKYANLREILYDLMIYNANIDESIYYILNELKAKIEFDSVTLSSILVDVFVFFRYYNNNYRPIYHLELLFLSIIQQIYGIK